MIMKNQCGCTWPCWLSIFITADNTFHIDLNVVGAPSLAVQNGTIMSSGTAFGNIKLSVGSNRNRLLQSNLLSVKILFVLIIICIVCRKYGMVLV